MISKLQIILLFNNAFIIPSLIILTVIPSSNFSALGFKLKTRHNLALIICHLLRRIVVKNNFFSLRSKHFLFSKTSWRRLENVFSVTIFDLSKTSSRRLQNVFARRLKDVFKTSSVSLHQDECLLGSYLKMHVEFTSNINQNQELYLIDLFKLFVAGTSWRIPEHRSNRIFDCHPTRIFEFLKALSKNQHLH